MAIVNAERANLQNNKIPNGIGLSIMAMLSSDAATINR